MQMVRIPKSFVSHLLDLPSIEAKEATEPGFTLVLHTELLRSTGNDKATVTRLLWCY